MEPEGQAQSQPTASGSIGAKGTRRHFLQTAFGAGAAALAGTSLIEEHSIRIAHAGTSSVSLKIAVLSSGQWRPFFTKLWNSVRALGHQVNEEYANHDYRIGPGGELRARMDTLLTNAPDVIITGDTPAAKVALQARNFHGMPSIPIVMAIVTDMVFVTTGESPIDNLVAISESTSHTPGTRVALFLDLLDNAGLTPPNSLYIVRTVNPGLQKEVTLAIDYVNAFINATGIRVAINETTIMPPITPSGNQLPYNPGQYVAAFSTAVPDEAGVMILEDPATFNFRTPIINVANSKRLFTVWESLAPVQDGGLVCWGPTREDAWIAAANLALSIWAEPPIPGAGVVTAFTLRQRPGFGIIEAVPLMEHLPPMFVNKATAEARGFREFPDSVTAPTLEEPIPVVYIEPRRGPGGP